MFTKILGISQSAMALDCVIMISGKWIIIRRYTFFWNL